MGGGGEPGQDKLEAIRIAVAGYFPLVEFQLMQGGLNLVDGNAGLADLQQGVSNQALNFCGRCCFAAFETGHETHLAIRVFEATQGGGRCTQAGGFQCSHQGAGAVVQQHAAQQLRPEKIAEAGAVAKQPTHDNMGLAAGSVFGSIKLLYLDR